MEASPHSRCTTTDVEKIKESLRLTLRDVMSEKRCSPARIKVRTKEDIIMQSIALAEVSQLRGLLKGEIVPQSGGGIKDNTLKFFKMVLMIKFRGQLIMNVRM